MSDRPTAEELQQRHRWCAVEANNRAWALSEQPELSVAEQDELLDAAHAAADHWKKVGTPTQVAHANVLLGRAHARLGHGALAMRFATAAFEALASLESAPWEMAFAHAILANAGAASKDSRVHAEHYAQAKVLGEGLADPQDRKVFQATFDRIPVPGSDRTGQGTG